MASSSRPSRFTEGSPSTLPDLMAQTPTSNELFYTILNEMDEFESRKRDDSNRQKKSKNSHRQHHHSHSNSYDSTTSSSNGSNGYGSMENSQQGGEGYGYEYSGGYEGGYGGDYGGGYGGDYGGGEGDAASLEKERERHMEGSDNTAVADIDDGGSNKLAKKFVGRLRALKTHGGKESGKESRKER